MTDPGRRRPRRLILVATLAVAAAAGLALARWWPSGPRGPRDHTASARSGSPYLRDIREPIAIVKGSSVAGSDDHWMGLTIRGANGAEREVKFIFYWPPAGAHPGYTRTLLLGEAVPAGGVEERAFLGVLQRWYRRDPEARDLRARVERRDPTLGRTPFGWDGLTGAQAGKVVAVGMMRVLEDRN